MSVLLRGEDAPAPASLLTVVTAISIVDAIGSETGLEGRILWPNDVVIGEKKVGGILIEMRQEAGRTTAIVIGLGLNAGLRPEELPQSLQASATSLAEEGASGLDRHSLVRAILRSLDGWCDRLRRGEIEPLRAQWRSLSCNLGRRATVHQNEERFEGVVVDLDPIEGLSLDLGDGEIRTFPAEHVTLQ